MGRQTAVYVLPPNFKNVTPISMRFPHFRYAGSSPDISSPDNAGDAASATETNVRSPCFSQTHSHHNVHIKLSPILTLCHAVLCGTYFCSWNFNKFSIQEIHISVNPFFDILYTGTISTIFICLF